MYHHWAEITTYESSTPRYFENNFDKLAAAAGNGILTARLGTLE
jgi:hypothetical protein